MSYNEYQSRMGLARFIGLVPVLTSGGRVYSTITHERIADSIPADWPADWVRVEDIASGRVDPLALAIA